MLGILFSKLRTFDLGSWLFLSPRTSIGFHKRLKITSIDFHERSFLKEYSPMGNLDLQMRPTADFLCPQRNFGRHIVIALSVRPSVPFPVRCISPIFFEVGIPNLVCGCILGWRSVPYHFRVTVTLTLTSDLVFIVIKCPSIRPASCPVHITYTLWGRNSKFDVWMHLGMAKCRVLFLGHCDLDLDLWPSF